MSENLVIDIDASVKIQKLTQVWLKKESYVDNGYLIKVLNKTIQDAIYKTDLKTTMRCPYEVIYKVVKAKCQSADITRSLYGSQ